MESLYAVLFESVPIVQGHFLWPKYSALGAGYFLCRVPESERSNQLSPIQRRDRTNKFVRKVLDEDCARKYYGHCLATSIPFEVSLENQPETKKLREGIQWLMQRPDSESVFYAQPPPSMPQAERLLYQQIEGFQN